MNTSLNRPSAQILQFPVGGRSAISFAREAAKIAAEPAEPVIYEGAWYHAEAIKDADPKRPQ